MPAPMQQATNGKVEKRFQTGPQIFIDGAIHGGDGKGRLHHRKLKTDKYFDDMLKDPTIRLAVDVVVGMMMKIPWSVEGKNDEYNEFVSSQIEPHRRYLIRAAFFGILKFGWRTFETLYDVEQTEMLGMRQILKGVKSLDCDRTVPLVYVDDGNFAGVENTNIAGDKVWIDERHTIFINPEMEGLGGLNEPLLRVAESACRKWDKCDEGASRYDEKVAGGFMAIGHPVGKSKVEINGEVIEVDNAQAAEAFGHKMKAAGFATYPIFPNPDTGMFDMPDVWKFQQVTGAANGQPSFIARQKYLDALKLRAFGIPERSTTEGTFGTKAEAEAHADIAIMVNVEREESIIEGINLGCIEPLNASNTGDEGACRLVLGQLDPNSRQLFQQIFAALMVDPVFVDETARRVDISALMDKLNIPQQKVEPFSSGPEIQG